MLTRLLRRFPGGAVAADVRALFDDQFTPEKVAGECAYFDRATARAFKRPCGWAWLLKLAAELALGEERRWSAVLEPLAQRIVRRFVDFLPLAAYPVRVGTHFNTAFGLRMATDYAEVAGDAALRALLLETVRRWYGGDVDCPAWGEPSGDDFQSPALIEVECMRRLLPGPEFPA